MALSNLSSFLQANIYKFILEDINRSNLAVAEGDTLDVSINVELRPRRASNFGSIALTIDGLEDDTGEGGNTTADAVTALQETARRELFRLTEEYLTKDPEIQRNVDANFTAAFERGVPLNMFANVRINQRDRTRLNPEPARAALQGPDGRFISQFTVLNLFNSLFADFVRQQMLSSIEPPSPDGLRNVTGRFARSFRLDSFQFTPNNSLVFYFSYDRVNYSSFAEGGYQYSRNRDPFNYAENAMRSIAMTVLHRRYARQIRRPVEVR